MTMLLPAELIRKKRNGHELTSLEIESWIQHYTDGTIPDYQMAAFLMAVYFRGMTTQETSALVKAMMSSGQVLTWQGHANFRVDKHSTGGIGDKTSLILAPLVAAAGLSVPMMSGRGLGHTGGTLDKLESVPGFSTQISLVDFDHLVRNENLAMIGQTPAICPADKKMYALRDVTGTVESLPLVCASIMSKKLAEGIDGLVLDVKFGSGAFFKEQEKARELAKALKGIGLQFGKKVTALLTNMNQPLGAFAGNALEMFECAEILKGKTRLNDSGLDLYEDTRQLSLELAAQMLVLSGQFGAMDDCRRKVESLLSSGAGYVYFEKMLSNQGGRFAELPQPKHHRILRSDREGYVTAFNSEKIGYLNVALGAGRAKVEDLIEPTAGMEFHAKIGHKVKIGSPLVTLYGLNPDKFAAIEADVLGCITVSPQFVAPAPLIVATL